MRQVAWATALVVLVFFVVAVVGWELTYPSDGDPKNIKYVLWKTGLYRMTLDLVTDTMIGDPGSDKLVVGKTKTQLRERFGYLLPPAEASPYLRGCYKIHRGRIEMCSHPEEPLDGCF